MKKYTRTILASLFLLLSSRAGAVDLSAVIEFDSNSLEAMAIVVNGPIEVGDSEKLGIFIAENPEHKRVIFNSPGGVLLEGIKIGRILRNAGLTAEIGRLKEGAETPQFENAVCASACAVAFLGGAERYIGESMLGFHQFYQSTNFEDFLKQVEITSKISEDAQVMSALLSAYIQDLGDIDQKILLISASTPPEDMYWISREAAIELGIESGVDAWTDIWIEPYSDGLVAATRRKKSATGYEGRGPYDTVSQATFFCREGKYFVMLSAGYKMSVVKDSATKVITSFRTTAGIEMEYDISQDLLVRGSEEAGWTDVSLPEALAKKVMSSDYFGIRVFFPRVTGGVQNVAINLDEAARKKIGWAFKSCI